MFDFGSCAPSRRTTWAVLAICLTMSAIDRSACPASCRWMYQAFSMTRETSRTRRRPCRSAVARTERRFARLKGCCPSAKDWSRTTAAFRSDRRTSSAGRSTFPVKTAS